MELVWLNRTIGAWKLAGRFDGLYYACIGGMIDFDIKPSKYPRVTIKRIKAAYAMKFIFE